MDFSGVVVDETWSPEKVMRAKLLGDVLNDVWADVIEKVGREMSSGMRCILLRRGDPDALYCDGLAIYRGHGASMGCESWLRWWWGLEENPVGKADAESLSLLERIRAARLHPAVLEHLDAKMRDASGLRGGRAEDIVKTRLSNLRGIERKSADASFAAVIRVAVPVAFVLRGLLDKPGTDFQSSRPLP